MTLAQGRLSSRGVARRDVVLLAAAAAMWLLDVVSISVMYPHGLLTPDGITFAVGLALLIVAGTVSLNFDSQRGNGRLMLWIALLNSGQDVCLNFASVGPFAFFYDVVPWLADVMLGHLLLRWPQRGLQTRPQRIALVVGYCGLVPLMVAADLFYSARAFGVPRSAWWPTVVFDPTLTTVLFRLGVWAFAGLLAVFVVLVALRIVRAPRPERRELAVVGVAIALLVVSGALTVLQDSGTGADANLVGNLALLIVPVALLASIVVRRVQRALAIEALASHGRDGEGSAVIRELRRAMGDRRLDVAIYSIESGRYVSFDGTEAPDVREGREAMFVAAADGAPLARLDVAAALAGRRELAGPIAEVAVIALEASRLRAELTMRATAEETARRQLEEAADEGARLSRLLPGGLPEKLRTDPGALGRIDDAEVSVLMSDVRGYTTIAEHTTPVQLAQQLREHRSAMNAAILAEGGTVMQYVGDAVMAVFGAPFAQEDHAARAIRTAAAMHHAQDDVNARWSESGWSPFLLGIGISSGAVATAVLGSEERYEYTVVGDTVNLAQRLENEARPGRTTVLSAATIEAAHADGPAQLLELHVKGRERPVTAYRLTSA